MDDLKNCPFCCGKPKVKTFSGRIFLKKMKTYYVECTSCGARTTVDFEADTVKEKWNRRTEDGEE